MGKLELPVILTVEPEGRGSRFTRRVEMEMPGLIAPLMGDWFRKHNAGFRRESQARTRDRLIIENMGYQ